jgi:hypothetical protein
MGTPGTIVGCRNKCRQFLQAAQIFGISGLPVDATFSFWLCWAFMFFIDGSYPGSLCPIQPGVQCWVFFSRCFSLLGAQEF